MTSIEGWANGRGEGQAGEGERGRRPTDESQVPSSIYLGFKRGPRWMPRAPKDRVPTQVPSSLAEFGFQAGSRVQLPSQAPSAACVGSIPSPKAHQSTLLHARAQAAWSLAFEQAVKDAYKATKNRRMTDALLNGLRPPGFVVLSWSLGSLARVPMVSLTRL